MFGLRFCSLPQAAFQQGRPVTVTWQAPPRPTGIPKATVDLWLLDLHHGGAPEGFWATLSADERDRAGRFHFAEDRQRFVVGRGVLRHLVGRYLDQPPGEIVFTYNAWGKPGLPAGVPIEFNSSGTAEMALYAFSGGAVLGVDIEQVRADFEWEEISAAFFDPAETAYLARLPIPERHRVFYRHWTIREALVKAQGVGLSEPLPAFDFTPLVGGNPVSFNDASGARWSCLSFAPAEQAVAALVVQA